MIFPSPTWWYSDRMLCISSTSSLEISFPTNVRSYDVSSSPTHAPSSFLMGGLRARETCWWEYDKGTSSCRNTSTQRLLISIWKALLLLSEGNVLFMCALSDASKFCYANMSSVEWIKMPGECKCPTNECKCWPGWTCLQKVQGPDGFSVFPQTG